MSKNTIGSQKQSAVMTGGIPGRVWATVVSGVHAMADQISRLRHESNDEEAPPASDDNEEGIHQYVAGCSPTTSSAITQMEDRGLYSLIISDFSKSALPTADGKAGSAPVYILGCSPTAAQATGKIEDLGLYSPTTSDSGDDGNDT